MSSADTKKCHEALCENLKCNIESSESQYLLCVSPKNPLTDFNLFNIQYTC